MKFFSTFPSSTKVEFAEAATKSAYSEFSRNPKRLLDGAGVKPFKFKERDGTTVHRLAFSEGCNFYLKRYPRPKLEEGHKIFYPRATAIDYGIRRV